MFSIFSIFSILKDFIVPIIEIIEPWNIENIEKIENTEQIENEFQEIGTPAETFKANHREWARELRHSKKTIANDHASWDIQSKP